MSGYACACGGDTKVTDSRANRNGSVRRRRECLSCRNRFSTWEVNIGVYRGMLTQLGDLAKKASAILSSVGPTRDT